MRLTRFGDGPSNLAPAPCRPQSMAKPSLGLVYFDRVNHDILMSRIARHVDDERVLKLMRRYLEAGLTHDGLEETRTMCTPPGGPSSPLLSNILLTDRDRELERR